MWHELQGGQYDTMYSTSGDGGASWGGPTVVWDGSALGYNCYYGSLAVDHADEVHIATWANGKIQYKYWTVGAGWSAAYDLSGDADPGGSQQYPQLSVYSDSTVQMAFQGDKAGWVGRMGIRTTTFTKPGGFGAITDVEFEAGFNLDEVAVLVDSNDDWWICFTTRIGGSPVVKVETSGAKTGTHSGVAIGTTRGDGTLTRDRNDNIYMIWDNASDDKKEYKRLDYAADIWGAKVDIVAAGVIGARTNMLGGNAPTDQNIPPENGTDDFGVIYQDDTDLIYNGNATWGGGGGGGGGTRTKFNRARRRPGTVC